MRRGSQVRISCGGVEASLPEEPDLKAKFRSWVRTETAALSLEFRLEMEKELG